MYSWVACSWHQYYHCKYSYETPIQYPIMVAMIEISYPNNRYLKQLEKGSRFHIDEFMRGYNSGYNACLSGSPSEDGYRDGYEKGHEDGLEHPINREIRDGNYGNSQRFCEGYLREQGFVQLAQYYSC